LAAERGTVEVVIDSRVTSTVISVVVPLVGPDVSVPIHRGVVASAKLVHVTMNIGVSRPIDREVSLAFNRNIVISRANGLVPREVSFPKILIPREISFPRHAHLVLSGHCV
jgi:hypothetical protein